ncbi:hypothetical protein C0991_007033, partial [Blastosporella zonata]
FNPHQGLMTTRGPSRANSSGPTNSGTPIRPQLIRNEPLSAIIGDTGPIRSASDARQYLKTNSWVLAAESYDRNKIARIIATVAIGGATQSRAASNTMRPKVRNTLLVVAFLIDEDITDNIANIIAETVASRTIACLEPITNSLATSASFVAANDTNRANNTLTLQTITDKLTTSIDILNNAPPATTAPPSLPPTTHANTPLSWAAVANTNIPASLTFNPKASDRHTRLQQRIIKESQTVTFEYLTRDPLAPQDYTPTGLAKLQTDINNALAAIDKEEHPTLKTFIRGIREIPRPDTDKTNLVLELDTPESANRIADYTTSILHTFPHDTLGNTARISTRPHNIII